jgi:hypothetical protein
MLYDPSQLIDASDNAPEAGFAPVNYGKLDVVINAISWKDKVKGVRPLKAGEKASNGETLELEFSVEIAEFNPALEFKYTRNVPIRKSGRQLADWAEIVLPSLEKVFGGNGAWAKAILAHPYVEVEDAPNINGGVSKSGKVWGVPKFLSTFKTTAECQAARDKRFGPSGTSGTAPANVPSGTPDATVIGQVRSLIQSVGEKMAHDMLAEKKPFGDFDADQLIALAKA